MKCVDSKMKDACFLAWLLTLPCFFSLVKVSEIPTVGTVLRAAIGVNLLTGVTNLWEEKRRKELVSGLFFFNWKKLVVGDLKAIAIENQWWLCLAEYEWKYFFVGLSTQNLKGFSKNENRDFVKCISRFCTL